MCPFFPNFCGNEANKESMKKYCPYTCRYCGENIFTIKDTLFQRPSDVQKVWLTFTMLTLGQAPLTSLLQPSFPAKPNLAELIIYVIFHYGLKYDKGTMYIVFSLKTGRFDRTQFQKKLNIPQKFERESFSQSSLYLQFVFNFFCSS